MADKPRKERSADELIFREIDEELRQDRARALWQQYGGYVIGAAVALVLGVAGYQGWTAYDRSTREARGDRYAAADAQAAAGNPQAAAASFAELAADAGAGYETLARLRQAAAMIEAGNREGALGVYDAMAGNDDIDPLYRGLADLLWAMSSIDTGDPSAVEARLEPLTGPDGAWRYTAMEMLALLYKREGDVPAARDLYTRIADDDQAPPAVRGRAREMIDELGGAASS